MRISLTEECDIKNRRVTRAGIWFYFTYVSAEETYKISIDKAIPQCIMWYEINLFPLITNYSNILLQLLLMILLLRSRFKVVRVAHFAIPSPKYFAPFSPMWLLLRSRFKLVRVTHFAIPSPKLFAPFSSMLLLLRSRFKVERVTHFAIPSPKYFAPFSPIPLLLRDRFKEVRVTHFDIPSPKYFAPFSPILLR